jgi:hypothetical protein
VPGRRYHARPNCGRGQVALLVPLPTATDDHQRRNAEALAPRGGQVLLQRDLTGRVLADGCWRWPPIAIGGADGAAVRMFARLMRRGPSWTALSSPRDERLWVQGSGFWFSGTRSQKRRGGHSSASEALA